MADFHLTQNQLWQLVFDNRQEIKHNNLSCLCIDNYLETSPKTSLLIPGGDLGQIAILFSAANSFGFEINKEKLLTFYFAFLKGEKNFHLEDRCHYFNLIKSHFDKFQLDKTNIAFLDKIAKKIKRKPYSPIFQKDNQPNGIVIIRGEATIPSRSFLKIETNEGKKTIEVFLISFQQSLFEERQKILAKKLVNEKIVNLYPGLDEDYLRMTLIETGENHFYEYINNFAKNLPLQQVNFQANLKFEIKDLGEVVGV